MQKASGNKTSEYAREKLFEPLGIQLDHWHWSDDPQGISDGADGLWMTPRDMTKIGLLCLNNGTWDGQEIVAASYMESVKIDQETPLRESNYGLHFWIHDWWPYYCYGALGWNGQRIIMFDEINLVVVFTGRVDDYNEQSAIILNDYIFPALLEEDPTNGGPDPLPSIPGYSLIIIGSLVSTVLIMVILLTKRKIEQIKST